MASHSEAELAARLRAFYSKHNPAKLGNVETVTERYFNRQPELCARLERKYGEGSFSVGNANVENVVLAEHAEPVASAGGACRKVSHEEYAESGRVQTEAALKALVADMQNSANSADLGRRLTRSRKMSLVKTAKSLLGRLYKSDGVASKTKRAQEVTNLAERIINTHYYYHGNLSGTRKKTAKGLAPSPQANTNKENATAFVTATPTGVQRPRPNFLNDLLKKPNLKKSSMSSVPGTVRPRPNFLSELTNKKSSGLRKVGLAGSKGVSPAKKRPLSLLEEIKLKALQARKDTGMNRSPGMTPLKSQSAVRRSSLGPNGGLRNALEEALAKRFQHIQVGKVASPAMSEMSDF